MTIRHFVAHTIRCYLTRRRTEAMAKTKTLVISGPMDAKHVGGVNVLGNSGSSFNDFFSSTAVVPDERPSHTFVATGRTEAPRRSDTVADTLRRTSVSLSKLRRNSSSHHTEAHYGSDKGHEMGSQVKGSDSKRKPLKMRSSMSRLRQKVGLDHESYDTAPMLNTHTPEPQHLSEPIRQEPLELQDSRALARLTTTSSIYSNVDPDPAQPEIIRKQRPLVVQRRPSPLESQTSNASPQPPTRPKRTDSGTAIDIRNVPIQERPIPFKEILAVSSLDERMAMYKKTREYWAHADHELVAWTKCAAGPKAATTRP
jgi:hypothetical protein